MASNQIVVPTFVSTTCICIVWVPLFQLGGVAGYLFLPLAEAVIFAMIASFILSRTLTPTLADYLLRGQVAALQGKGHHRFPVAGLYLIVIGRHSAAGCVERQCWRPPQQSCLSSPALND
jgi:multidrug efflux pump subunit AcrB